MDEIFRTSAECLGAGGTCAAAQEFGFATAKAASQRAPSKAGNGGVATATGPFRAGKIRPSQFAGLEGLRGEAGELEAVPPLAAESFAGASVAGAAVTASFSALDFDRACCRRKSRYSCGLKSSSVPPEAKCRMKTLPTA